MATTLSPCPKVESVCPLLSSVLRERAGRGGEEGEAVTEEESQAGDQRRQDREQSSGESTPAAANLPPHQGNTVFLSLSLKMCSLLIPVSLFCLNNEASLSSLENRQITAMFNLFSKD